MTGFTGQASMSGGLAIECLILGELAAMAGHSITAWLIEPWIGILRHRFHGAVTIYARQPFLQHNIAQAARLRPWMTVVTPIHCIRHFTCMLFMHGIREAGNIRLPWHSQCIGGMAFCTQYWPGIHEFGSGPHFPVVQCQNIGFNPACGNVRVGSVIVTVAGVTMHLGGYRRNRHSSRQLLAARAVLYDDRCQLVRIGRCGRAITKFGQRDADCPRNDPPADPSGRITLCRSDRCYPAT